MATSGRSPSTRGSNHWAEPRRAVQGGAAPSAPDTAQLIVAWPTPLESDDLDRRHVLFAWAICLEAAVSFAGPVALLLFGTLYLPLTIAGLLADPAGTWQWPFLATLTVGWIGVAGVARVLFILCTRQQRDRRVRLTLMALACGIALALFLWYRLPPEEMIARGPIAFVYLPLACTVHLACLARRPLFTRPATLS
jgi:hypothetical protein